MLWSLLPSKRYVRAHVLKCLYVCVCVNAHVYIHVYVCLYTVKCQVCMCAPAEYKNKKKGKKVW